MISEILIKLILLSIPSYQVIFKIIKIFNSKRNVNFILIYPIKIHINPIILLSKWISKNQIIVIGLIGDIGFKELLSFLLFLILLGYSIIKDNKKKDHLN